MAEVVQEKKHVNYKLYWLIWLVLLVLTVIMLFVGHGFFSRMAVVSLLLVAMSAKAGLIGGYFMHLRFEKLVLVLMVALAIVLTALALFVLIAPDGARILRLSQ